MKGQTSIAVVFACLIALATVHLHPVLAMDSSPAAKLHNHASMYLDLGEWQRARADYSEAIRLDSTNALYYNDRGLVYQLMRDYDHALADYGNAIEIDPTFVTAYNNRGMLYYGNKEYERAIADHERAIKINPQSSTAYRNLGNALFYGGEFLLGRNNKAEATRMFALAIAECPPNYPEFEGASEELKALGVNQ